MKLHSLRKIRLAVAAAVALMAAAAFAACSHAYTDHYCTQCGASDGYYDGNNVFTVTASGNTFTIARTNSHGVANCHYRTVGESAVAGIHFYAASGLMEFNDGDSSKTVTVTERSAPEIGSVVSRYQNEARTYRLEVRSSGGLVSAQRTLPLDNAYKISETCITNTCAIRVPYESGKTYFTFTDAGYAQRVLNVGVTNLFNRIGPNSRDYFGAVSGARIYSRISFNACEEEDGYQHVQILRDKDGSVCDTGAGDGDPGNLVNASYLACFEHKSGSTGGSYRSYYFPVENMASNGASATPWTQYRKGTVTDYNTYKLTKCKYKPADVDTKAGYLNFPISTQTINLRFNASGSGGDNWRMQDLHCEMMVKDATGPAVVALHAPDYTTCADETLTLALSFDEIVTVSGSPTLKTTLGDFGYGGGSGSNVLYFNRLLDNTADSQSVKVTELSGGTIKDLAGNAAQRDTAEGKTVRCPVKVKEVMTHTVSGNTYVDFLVGQSPTALYIPSDSKYVNEHAFNGDTNVTEVTMPASIVRGGILKGAFHGCTNIQTVNITHTCDTNWLASRCEAGNYPLLAATQIRAAHNLNAATGNCRACNAHLNHVYNEWQKCETCGDHPDHVDNGQGKCGGCGIAYHPEHFYNEWNKCTACGDHPDHVLNDAGVCGGCGFWNRVDVDYVDNGATRSLTIPREWLAANNARRTWLKNNLQLDLETTNTAEVVEKLKLSGANGIPIWQSYVAGLEPENPSSEFTASITLTNGVPYISWSPNLNTDNCERVYRVLGCTELNNQWEYACVLHKFFKVKVSMPVSKSDVSDVPGEVQYADAIINGHLAVQLWEGGPYWATCNIGATQPEDYGYYFWWGDTVGYEWVNSSWAAVDGSTNSFSFSNANCQTYDKSASTLENEGWTKNGVLAPEHDAATVHWGGKWRMPTSAEISALFGYEFCWSTDKTRNGVRGVLVTGHGDYANRSIFLPCTGFGQWEWLFYSTSRGNYWTSTPSLLSSWQAWHLLFSSNTLEEDRSWGFPVRAVSDFTE